MLGAYSTCFDKPKAESKVMIGIKTKDVVCFQSLFAIEWVCVKVDVLKKIAVSTAIFNVQDKHERKAEAKSECTGT